MNQPKGHSFPDCFPSKVFKELQSLTTPEPTLQNPIIKNTKKIKNTIVILSERVLELPPVAPAGCLLI